MRRAERWVLTQGGREGALKLPSKRVASRWARAARARRARAFPRCVSSLTQPKNNPNPNSARMSRPPFHPPISQRDLFFPARLTSCSAQCSSKRSTWRSARGRVAEWAAAASPQQRREPHLTPQGLPLTPRVLPLTPRGLPLTPRGLPLTPRGVPLTPRGVLPPGAPPMANRESGKKSSVQWHSSRRRISS